MSSSAISKPVLPFTSAPRQDFASYLQQLATLEPFLISELEKQDEQTILNTRAQAQQLEKHGWRICCACDAAIWTQTEQAKRGRGKKDIDAVGILAAVAKKSKTIGVTPRTIYKNAEVFRLMQQAKEENVAGENNILDVLDDKGYYTVALSAAEPVDALKFFCERKLSQPRFRVSDANRLLKAEGKTRKATALKAVEQIREQTGQLSARQALLAHIEAAKKILEEQIIPNCPDEEFKERVWDELLLDLKDQQQELFDEDVLPALIKAWDGGAHREDQIAQVTQLPLPDVSRLMNSLATQELFIKIQPRDMKKRSKFQLWHKVGEPFDNAEFIPTRSSRGEA